MRARRVIGRGAAALAMGLVAGLVAPARPAEAAGMITHAWMAEVAIDHVGDDALRTLLLAHADQVEAGATFPDTGYVSPNTFGEEAHWQRFVDAYAAEVLARDDCGDLTAADGPCAPMIAHLFGVAAHGMGDQVWDWLFEPQSPDRDEYYVHPDFGSFGGVGGQELQLDLVAVGRHGRPRPAIPPLPDTQALLDAFAASGLDGVTAAQFAFIIVPQIAWDAYQIWIPNHLEPLTEAMPWMAANLVEGAGGVKFGGVAIAGYWDSLWGGLLGDKPPTTVSITYPADGERRIPAAGWVRTYQPGSSPGRGGARTRITAVLTDSLPYVPATGGPDESANLPATSMTLVEQATGTSVPIMAGYPRAVPYGPSAGEHMVDVQPAVDLQPCTWYDASVTSALVDSDHEPVTPHTWSFRTGADALGSRCADDPLLPDETEIAGTVRGPDGTPAPGATVAAYAGGDGFVPTASAVAGPDGTYRLVDLPAGTYRLHVSPPPGSSLVGLWSGGAASRLLAEPVEVGAGAPAGADGQLASATSVTGRVVDDSGAPIAGLTVAALSEGNPWFPEGTAVTAADGTYAVTGLAPGAYHIAFVPAPTTGLTWRWYPGAPDRAGATPVDTTAGDASGVDLTLASAPTLSGTVTGPGDAPLAGVRVVLYRPDDRLLGSIETVTRADGTYQLLGLAADTYRVRFVPPPGSGLGAEWYDGSATRAAATPLDLATGSASASARLEP